MQGTGFFYGFGLYIIQRRRDRGIGSELGGDFMPSGFYGLGCGNVGMDACQQVSGGQVEGGGGGDDGLIRQAAAHAGKVQGSSAHSDSSSGGSGGAAGGLQGVEGAGKCRQVVEHGSSDRLQSVDGKNARVVAVVVSKPVCFARSVVSRRGGWVIAAAHVRACLAVCNAGVASRKGLEDARRKSWLSSITGGERVVIVGGSREKGFLDAPALLASGGAVWSPGGGVLGTVRREPEVIGGQGRLFARSVSVSVGR